jgi:hypothetical protein
LESENLKRRHSHDINLKDASKEVASTVWSDPDTELPGKAREFGNVGEIRRSDRAHSVFLRAAHDSANGHWVGEFWENDTLFDGMILGDGTMRFEPKLRANPAVCLSGNAWELIDLKEGWEIDPIYAWV